MSWRQALDLTRVGIKDPEIHCSKPLMEQVTLLLEMAMQNQLAQPDQFSPEAFRKASMLLRAKYAAEHGSPILPLPTTTTEPSQPTKKRRFSALESVHEEEVQEEDGESSEEQEAMDLS